MDLNFSAFTWFHTVLSLIAIVAGLVVVLGMLRAERLGGWTALFMVTAAGTSITGFLFPFDRFLPSHWVGVISLVLIAIAVVARYVGHLVGAWRWIYAVCATLTFYFLVFVLIAQAFSKVHALRPLAPTQSEPPFVVSQLALLVLALALIIAAVRSFRPVLEPH